MRPQHGQRSAAKRTPRYIKPAPVGVTLAPATPSDCAQTDTEQCFLPLLLLLGLGAGARAATRRGYGGYGAPGAYGVPRGFGRWGGGSPGGYGARTGLGAGAGGFLGFPGFGGYGAGGYGAGGYGAGGWGAGGYPGYRGNTAGMRRWPLFF